MIVRQKKELTYEELAKRAERLKWFCVGIWVALGLYNLLSEVNKFDYAAVWGLLLVFMLTDIYWMKQRVEEREHRHDHLGAVSKLYTSCFSALVKVERERDALHAIVAKDGLCETCKHHKSCVYEDGPIEMDCVGCEREDCKCAGCTSKNDHWEWAGVKEVDHEAD